MTKINIQSVMCRVCRLPNGEAAVTDVCRHCRVAPRAKDAGAVPRLSDAVHETPAIDTAAIAVTGRRN